MELAMTSATPMDWYIGRFKEPEGQNAITK